MEDGLRGDAMEFLGTLTILIALAYTPWMMAKRRGIPMPPPPHVLVWYVLRVALFVFDFVISSGATSRRFPPFSASDVSSISVELETAPEPEDRTNERTNVGPSVLARAIQSKRIDVIRRETIDSLVMEGAGTDVIRQLLKGTNTTIGEEVAEAKERLGIEEGERKILVSDSAGKRLISL
jgi:hypothetical protein